MAATTVERRTQVARREPVGSPLPCAEAALDLCRLTEATRISAEQETALFARMRELERYAAFVAGLAVESADQAHPLLGERRSALAEARGIRDALVRVFLKLAAGAVRPFLCPRFSFDELNSEACLALLKSVEMFDHRRGFRFSTYATTAIRRQLERYVGKRRREQKQLGGAVDQLDGVQERPSASAFEETRRAAWLRTLFDTFARLAERDRAILARRFGLDANAGACTLQVLADEMNVSRERVRQLESRALRRLRGLVEGERTIEA